MRRSSSPKGMSLLLCWSWKLDTIIDNQARPIFYLRIYVRKDKIREAKFI